MDLVAIVSTGDDVWKLQVKMSSKIGFWRTLIICGISIFVFFILNILLKEYHTFFQVRGQLENETWSNIGVVWKPNTVNADDNVEGGLTVRRELSQGYLTPLICNIKR